MIRNRIESEEQSNAREKEDFVPLNISLPHPSNTLSLRDPQGIVNRKGERKAEVGPKKPEERRKDK
ncbi:hypothetical protein MJO28_011623 [Puccinia striiformis f. sp. tritici]|uniref:Uncharacterized protein n=1 Tax=Puccinia striiformis f. sp. tritici TaxID=168172 RepID=A0ACC0E4U6_9BASI|nr:hypothetical protein MJO28_011623 [Puccinia striiformis f. sp. tritici]